MTRAPSRDMSGLMGMQNGICVPLIIERRSEDTNRVLERKAIGIMWVFNKRYGSEFIEEDMALLDRLARNAASVIASAQMYREVIKEKEELEHVIQSVYAGIIMVNNNGRIMQMNPSAREMLNIDPRHPDRGALHRCHRARTGQGSSHAGV